MGLLQLDHHSLVNVYRYLDPLDIVHVGSTCSKCWNALKDDAVWRSLVLDYWNAHLDTLPCMQLEASREMALQRLFASYRADSWRELFKELVTTEWSLAPPEFTNRQWVDCCEEFPECLMNHGTLLHQGSLWVPSLNSAQWSMMRLDVGNSPYWEAAPLPRLKMPECDLQPLIQFVDLEGCMWFLSCDVKSQKVVAFGIHPQDCGFSSSQRSREEILPLPAPRKRGVKLRYIKRRKCAPLPMAIPAPTTTPAPTPLDSFFQVHADTDNTRWGSCAKAKPKSKSMFAKRAMKKSGVSWGGQEPLRLSQPETQREREMGDEGEYSCKGWVHVFHSGKETTPKYVAREREGGCVWMLFAGESHALCFDPLLRASPFTRVPLAPGSTTLVASPRGLQPCLWVPALLHAGRPSAVLTPEGRFECRERRFVGGATALSVLPANARVVAAELDANLNLGEGPLSRLHSFMLRHNAVDLNNARIRCALETPFAAQSEDASVTEPRRDTVIVAHTDDQLGILLPTGPHGVQWEHLSECSEGGSLWIDTQHAALLHRDENDCQSFALLPAPRIWETERTAQMPSFLTELDSIIRFWKPIDGNDVSSGASLTDPQHFQLADLIPISQNNAHLSTALSTFQVDPEILPSPSQDTTHTQKESSNTSMLHSVQFALPSTVQQGAFLALWDQGQGEGIRIPVRALIGEMLLEAYGKATTTAGKKMRKQKKRVSASSGRWREEKVKVYDLRMVESSVQCRPTLLPTLFRASLCLPSLSPEPLQAPTLTHSSLAALALQCWASISDPQLEVTMAFIDRIGLQEAERVGRVIVNMKHRFDENPMSVNALFCPLALRGPPYTQSTISIRFESAPHLAPFLVDLGKLSSKARDALLQLLQPHHPDLVASLTHPVPISKARLPAKKAFSSAAPAKAKARKGGFKSSDESYPTMKTLSRKKVPKWAQAVSFAPSAQEVVMDPPCLTLGALVHPVAFSMYIHGLELLHADLRFQDLLDYASMGHFLFPQQHLEAFVSAALCPLDPEQMVPFLRTALRMQSSLWVNRALRTIQQTPMTSVHENLSQMALMGRIQMEMGESVWAEMEQVLGVPPGSLREVYESMREFHGGVVGQMDIDEPAHTRAQSSHTSLSAFGGPTDSDSTSEGGKCAHVRTVSIKSTISMADLKLHSEQGSFPLLPGDSIPGLGKESSGNFQLDLSVCSSCGRVLGLDPHALRALERSFTRRLLLTPNGSWASLPANLIMRCMMTHCPRPQDQLVVTKSKKPSRAHDANVDLGKRFPFGLSAGQLMEACACAWDPLEEERVEHVGEVPGEALAQAHRLLQLISPRLHAHASPPSQQLFFRAFASAGELPLALQWDASKALGTPEWQDLQVHPDVPDLRAARPAKRETCLYYDSVME